jgi:LL-diaminopimelate aminotransferase
VALEFNSLSKTYNMAGWRLGMAAGNPDVIDYLFTYKSQMDTSNFGPIFTAASLP